MAQESVGRVPTPLLLAAAHHSNLLLHLQRLLTKAPATVGGVERIAGVEIMEVGDNLKIKRTLKVFISVKL